MQPCLNFLGLYAKTKVMTAKEDYAPHRLRIPRCKTNSENIEMLEKNLKRFKFI